MKGFVVSSDRLLKAKKIEFILNNFLKREVTNLDVLDIGTGDGFISSYFVTKGNKVTCVDVEDQRTEKLAVFVKVNSSKLSFDTEKFDIVISNTVIEHVEDPKLHVQEIKRVLKKGGVCYMAVPNWNFPLEPHYKIPLIHYLPQSAFNRILKLTQLYKEDINLPSYREMMQLFVGFTIKEYTVDIIKNPGKYYMKRNFSSKLPRNLISVMKYISPTNIFILQK